MSAQQHLNVEIFNTPAEAPTFREPEHEPVSIDKVNVVKHGTEGGRPTVDIILTHDRTKQKFMMMLTGGLIRSLAGVVAAAEAER